MITVFHRGDAPQILATLNELGIAHSEVVFNNETAASEKIAALYQLDKLGRVDAFGRAMLPTTTIDNAYGRRVIGGDHADTVLAALPPVDRAPVWDHTPRADGRCSCKTDHVARILAEINVTEPRVGGAS